MKVNRLNRQLAETNPLKKDFYPLPLLCQQIISSNSGQKISLTGGKKQKLTPDDDILAHHEAKMTPHQND